MRISHHLAICCVLLLGGCAMHPRSPATTARAVLEYNAMQADAEDSLLVVNVLRARDRKPRHFTAVTAGGLTQTMKMGGSGTLADASSGKSSSALLDTLTRTFGLNGEFSSTPNMGVAPLSSKSFLTGYISGVKSEIIRYFETQNFDPELMLTLLLSDVQIGDATFRNSPIDKEGFKDFQQLVSLLARSDLELKGHIPEIGEDDYRGDPFYLPASEVAETQILASEQKLKVVGVPGAPPPPGMTGPWRLATVPTRQFGWQIDQCKLGRIYRREKDSIAPKVRASLGAFDLGHCEEGISKYTLMPRRVELLPEPVTGDKLTMSVRTTVRSPESIIYFLGQVLREQDASNIPVRYGSPDVADTSVAGAESSDTPARASCHSGHPIFVVRRDHANASKVGLEVEYDGQKWHVGSDDPCDRTMLTLGVVQIIFGLQKDATELPQPTTFNLVGG